MIVDGGELWLDVRMQLQYWQKWGWLLPMWLVVSSSSCRVNLYLLLANALRKVFASGKNRNPLWLAKISASSADTLCFASFLLHYSCSFHQGYGYP